MGRGRSRRARDKLRLERRRSPPQSVCHANGQLPHLATGLPVTRGVLHRKAPEHKFNPTLVIADVHGEPVILSQEDTVYRLEVEDRPVLQDADRLHVQGAP